MKLILYKGMWFKEQILLGAEFPHLQLSDFRVANGKSKGCLEEMVPKDKYVICHRGMKLVETGLQQNHLNSIHTLIRYSSIGFWISSPSTKPSGDGFFLHLVLDPKIKDQKRQKGKRWLWVSRISTSEIQQNMDWFEQRQQNPDWLMTGFH